MTVLRICFNGDSLVNGTNDPDFQGWPGRLAQAEVAIGHDLSVYNLGIRGDTSKMIAQRWRAECQARLPDIHPCALVFSFGVNDVAFENGVRRVEFDESLKIAEQMMTEAKSWLPTLWVGPPPVELDETRFFPSPDVTYVFQRTDIETLSNAYGALAQKIGIPYFDLYQALDGDIDWLDAFDGDDSVHPRQRGYELVARLLSEWPAWRRWFDD